MEVAKPADVPFPPPLDEGVTEEMHSLYIATPPPTPSPEVKSNLVISLFTISLYVRLLCIILGNSYPFKGDNCQIVYVPF